MAVRRRILLANTGMSYRGGTQAWVRQMAQVLGSEHEVSLFTPDHVVVPGVDSFDPGRSYDLALINHWGPFRALSRASIQKRILTSHGVLPYAEVPVLGADAYVSVSESVQAKYPMRSTVIRNPIDVDHFYSDRPVGRVLRRVAFVSNRQGRARPLVEEACRRLDLELRIVGKEAGVNDTQPVYEWADLVIGIARVAMEASAAGRNVLCFDYCGFHGMVTPESIPALQKSNFGGHSLGSWPSVGEVVKALESYDPNRDMRPYVVSQHRPKLIAESYLSLADRTPASSVARLIRSGPRQLTSPRVTTAAMRLGVKGRAAAPNRRRLWDR